MLRYILRRLGYGLLILIGVNLLTFFLFFTVNTPDDMARLNIGGKRVTQEQIDKWKAERGYDKPLLLQREAQGTERKLTRTVLWERSVSLMALDFGRSDSAAPATSATRSPAHGREPEAGAAAVRPAADRQRHLLAVLVFFRHSASTSGAWCCAW
jgi:hypothetical protein